MRSSKSRSRNKSNRNRSVGNVVNRVFDSSGPEGKVRGTPQQIIDKYNQLARDAQLSNDRVAFESFQQHAEHYTRMLSEAMREQEAKREQQERERQDRQQNQQNNNQHNNNQNQNRNNQGGGQGGGHQNNQRDDQNRRDDPSEAPQPEIKADEPAETGDSGLVDTPENAEPKPKAKRTRKPRAPKPEVEAEAPAPEATPDAAE